MIKKPFPLALLSMVLLLLMSMQQGCNDVPERVLQNPFTISQENTIIYETIGNPYYLDPHINYESFGNWISFNVYETLYTYPWDSADSNPTVPLLASDKHISEDGLEYTFFLKSNIEFHDGTPFNASCVKYNIERVLAVFDSWGPAWMISWPILGGRAVADAVYEYGEGSPQHIGNYTAWKSANDAETGAIFVMDTYTVRIRLAYPYAGFIAALTYSVGSMMSPTWVEANGGVVIGEQNEYITEHTCGTGPYMVESWHRDYNITLIKNQNYWRESAAQSQFPNAGSINTVIIRTNEDVNSRILNLQHGVTDGCYWPISHAYQVYDLEQEEVRSEWQDKVNVWPHNPTFNIMMLGFNMNPYINQSGILTESPFRLKSFRQVVSYIFNYSHYIDEVLYGYAQRLHGPVPKGMFGHADDLFMYKYNFTMALEKWNEAMAAGLDEIWANNSYQFTMYYSSGSSSVRGLPSMLIKYGIESILADPDAIQPSAPLSIESEGISWEDYLYLIQNRQLPIFYLGWAPDYADPDNYVDPFVKSTGSYPLRIGLGVSEGWDAPYVDGLIASASQSQNNTERIELYHEIQELIVEQTAYLWVYQAEAFHVERVEMNGYQFNPMHSYWGRYFYHYWKGLVNSTTSTSVTTHTTSITTTQTQTTTLPTTSALVTTTPRFDELFGSLAIIITLSSIAVIVVFGVLIVRDRLYR